MALYALSDPHLSLSVQKPMDVFGGRWNNYFDKLKENLEKLNNDDTVVMAGDISWGMKLEEAYSDLAFLNSTPGKKIIGKGNHDYWWNTMSKMEKFRSECGFDNIAFLFNNAYTADGTVICGSRGWYSDAEVAGCDNKLIIARECGRLEMSIKAGEKLAGDLRLGVPVVFMHYPPVYGDYRCEPIIDVLKSHGIKKCYFGHLHGIDGSRLIRKSDGIEFELCSADFIDFKPISVK